MKIEEQVLSREQMAHLRELGVDTSDASVMWYRCDDGNAERWYLQINNELSQGIARVMEGTVSCFVPTYTIGDLIEKVSKLFNGFDFSEGNPKDMLYSCLCWMAKNKKELIK